MQELKIKPAKYAQYKLLCIKTNHLNLLLKPACSCSVNGSCKAKIRSGEPNRKVASVTWEQIRAIAEDKMPD
jgi:large subunit ribosomal protein L11